MIGDAYLKLRWNTNYELVARCEGKNEEMMRKYGILRWIDECYIVRNKFCFNYQSMAECEQTCQFCYFVLFTWMLVSLLTLWMEDFDNYILIVDKTHISYC